MRQIRTSWVKPTSCDIWDTPLLSSGFSFFGFEWSKRRPPRAATREVLGKHNQSYRFWWSYASILERFVNSFLHLTLSKTNKTDSARRVAAHRAEPYMLIGWNSSQTGLPVKWALSALSWFDNSCVCFPPAMVSCCSVSLRLRYHQR